MCNAHSQPFSKLCPASWYSLPPTEQRASEERYSILPESAWQRNKSGGHTVISSFGREGGATGYATMLKWEEGGRSKETKLKEKSSHGEKHSGETDENVCNLLKCFVK